MWITWLLCSTFLKSDSQWHAFLSVGELLLASWRSCLESLCKTRLKGSELPPTVPGVSGVGSGVHPKKQKQMAQQPSNRAGTGPAVVPTLPTLAFQFSAESVCTGPESWQLFLIGKSDYYVLLTVVPQPFPKPRIFQVGKMHAITYTLPTDLM